MLVNLLKALIAAFLGAVPEEKVKEFIDEHILDPIEDYIAKTPNKYDDTLQSLINAIRSYFDIPDNDDPPETP